MGADILIEVMRLPGWKNGLNASREKSTCRYSRRNRQDPIKKKSAMAGFFLTIGSGPNYSLGAFWMSSCFNLTGGSILCNW